MTSDWSVLLAMTDKENVRLLSVVLDGFGYSPLECRSREEVYELLSKSMPAAAVVDVRMDESEEICGMVRERGGIGLLLLLDERSVKPDEQVGRFEADGWESVRAGPEKLLLGLRRLIRPEADE